MGRKRREMCENATGSSGESSELDTDSDRPSRGTSANNRERARMRVLSAAFGRLKNTLPWVPQDTKLSKLDTLRMASCYIANLAELLAQETGDLQHDAAATVRPAARLKLSKGFHRPVSLAWPYSLVNSGTSETVEDDHSLNAAKACPRFIGDKAVSCVD